MNASRNLDDAARAWQVAGAPAGFADRVVAAGEAASERPPRRSARTLVGVTVVVVAIAAALLLWTWSARIDRGSIDATARTTIELPMAVAVVEPGTALEWNEVRGGAEVRQSSGRAFYRVQSGAVFDVVTPAGRVSARGTAFEVEVEGMTKRKHIASGLAGVGIATAIVVTLYEGRVVVANDAGEATLSPGETARARAGERPQVGERETVAALKAELAALRRDVDVERRAGAGTVRAGGSVDESIDGSTDASSPGAGKRVDSREAVHKCALTVNGGPECPMLQPSQEVLERRADCGIVVWDRPSGIESADVDFSELAELADLDDGELAKLEESTRGFHAHVREQFETIYRELGGDAELASKLSPAALAAEIDKLTAASGEPDDHYHRAAEIVSSALAGRRPMPKLDELGPGDRHAFLWTAAGDMYEEWVAKSLGVARARELRAVNDGWTGNRGMQGDPHCPDAE